MLSKSLYTFKGTIQFKMSPYGSTPVYFHPYHVYLNFRHFVFQEQCWTKRTIENKSPYQRHGTNIVNMLYEICASLSLICMSPIAL